jgi:hypothetical protein
VRARQAAQPALTTLASEARAECSSAAALSSTPLGAPVDPEVPMMTAVLSATPISGPERAVVTPSVSSMVSGANAAISSASRARGRLPSSGRIAGPLPSSAAASSSTRRGLVRSTRTACKERMVTIVKVRTLTQGGYE